MASTRTGNGGVDKRRLILDAAIRVFARRGFHACRVSDVADATVTSSGACATTVPHGSITMDRP